MAELLRAQLDMVSRSARVRRYHTEDTMQPQTVGEHTYGVMWILSLIHDGLPPWRLLYAALLHDAPEYITGDVPAPVKRQHGVKPVFDNMEDELFQNLALEFPTLTEAERRLLKLADCLEGALFCVVEAERGNRRIQACLDNYIAYVQSMIPTGRAHDILQQIKERRNVIFG